MLFTGKKKLLQLCLMVGLTAIALIGCSQESAENLSPETTVSNGGKQIISAENLTSLTPDRRDTSLDEFIKNASEGKDEVLVTNKSPYNSVEEAINDILNNKPNPSPSTLRHELLMFRYSDDEISKAFENIEIDWVSYAIVQSNEFLSSGPAPSKQTLMDMLLFVDYSEEISERAIELMDIDWGAHAERNLLIAIRTSPEIGNSEQSMRDHLESEGFEQEFIDYAISKQ